MATFGKKFIRDYGSFEQFAKEDGCYKIYETDHDFISIRSERDEQAMFGSKYCKGAKLVWQNGRNIYYNWAELYNEWHFFMVRQKN